MASTTSLVAPRPSKTAWSATGEQHTIGIAGVIVVRAPDSVRTVLGSCIGVAIYDKVAGLGALGHVILPASAEGTGDPGKFAETAVDMLLENIVAAGAGRARLEAKIAGGASMFGPASSVNLGDRNTRAVRARLGEHRIPLRAEDVGGTKGRKMTLSPATGEVRVEIIGESAYTI